MQRWVGYILLVTRRQVQSQEMVSPSPIQVMFETVKEAEVAGSGWRGTMGGRKMAAGESRRFEGRIWTVTDMQQEYQIKQVKEGYVHRVINTDSWVQGLPRGFENWTEPVI